MKRNIKDILAPVRRGQAVVLSESYFQFLARSASEVSLVIVSGLLVALIKGGFWWVIVGISLAILTMILIWGLIRTSPQLGVDAEGLTFRDVSIDWSEIDSFGAGELKYMPDFVFVTDYDGCTHQLDSTFGWKNTELRDALNELLRSRNPDSSRAQFHEIQTSAASDEAEMSEIRFRRPTGPDDAIEQARVLLGRYYHPDCDTVTVVNDDALQKAALDPYYFPLLQTDCDGCGVARMTEAFSANGQTVQEIFQEMQNAVSLKAQLARYLLFAFVFCAMGILIGLCIPVTTRPWLPSFLAGGGGFVVGVPASMTFFRHLRRAGWFW